MYRLPEEHRLDRITGNAHNGVFEILLSGRTKARCIATNGHGWEHVSVVVLRNGKAATPTWSEMNRIKDIFWDEEDCVVQYHPPKKDYVNNHPNCLHLWRKIGEEIPRPPKILVGI